MMVVGSSMLLLLSACATVSALADHLTYVLEGSVRHVHNRQGLTFSGMNAAHDSLVFRRQSSCAAGTVPCGSNCIQSGYTCCPDGQGGCPPSQYCSQINSSSYGCCDNGENCEGPATGCPDSDYKPCGDVCFPESYTCCSLGGACEPGYSCGRDGCVAGSSEPSGGSSGGGGGSSSCDKKCGDTCFPESYICCSLGGACAPGFHCGPNGCLADGTCDPSEKHCGDECFPTDYRCCSGGGACEPGWHCGSTGCEMDSDTSGLAAFSSSTRSGPVFTGASATTSVGISAGGNNGISATATSSSSAATSGRSEGNSLGSRRSELLIASGALLSSFLLQYVL